MFISAWNAKWKPVYAPDTETGTAGTDDAAPPVVDGDAADPVDDRLDGPGSGRGSVRKEIEKAVASARESEAKDTKEERKPDRIGSRDRDTESGKFRKAATAGEGEGAVDGEQAVEGEKPAEGEAAAEGDQATTELKPPDAWSKEAKADWAKATPAIQAAAIKRETDVKKGIDEIKAKYTEIDQALTPRQELLRATGHTPAQAIHQLFAWHDALSADKAKVDAGQSPVAFLGLLKSHNVDPRSLFQPGTQFIPPGKTAPVAGAEGEEGKEQPKGAVPPELQTYIDGLRTEMQAMREEVDGRFKQTNQVFEEQNLNKTNEILVNWSKDKTYFDRVRPKMARLIGTGAIPPQANGAADLDAAYELAVYGDPEIRAEIATAEEVKRQAAQKAHQEKERKAQQEQADRARRAAGSLSPAAPGTSATGAQGKQSKGKSVRESIAEARAALEER